jgi:hypothetical protein
VTGFYTNQKTPSRQQCYVLNNTNVVNIILHM